MNSIRKIKNNFSNRYEFKNKDYTLENIMFENIREFSRYIMEIANIWNLQYLI